MNLIKYLTSILIVLAFCANIYSFEIKEKGKLKLKTEENLIIHTVAKDETLSEIAEKYYFGTSVHSKL